MGYSGLLWVIPGYYGLFRVIMGFCRTASTQSSGNLPICRLEIGQK